MNNLALFHGIAKNPNEYARELKKTTGRKIVGYFCSYAPEEIILAAGAVPFRIFGRGDVSLADAHLQAYSCSLVRGALEDALSGGLDFLDGVVFPHTCDSIQRLSDIWRINANTGFHIDVVLPVKLDAKSSKEYMADVIKKFIRDIEKSLGVVISADDLKASADKYNQIRAYLKKIFEIRSRNPAAIRSRDVHAIIKASMVMDRDVLLKELASFTKDLQQEGESRKAGGKRVVLAGGVCNLPDIYSLIEDSGGAVVWDDFCTGSRYFEGDIDLSGDILESIAGRYSDRIVCPAKHSGLFSRGEHVVKIAKENNAKGVIFLFLKFCDPHSFDYPYMKEMLDKEGIPSMLFEIEEQLPSEGQFKTRCEAFLEML
ncbi:MAG: 2-hydroxyacyl-CoA dehydratase family protein [Proteobacteria bacterium]|nr:2-hydroxyacyl-CoA dehydratase family protein [Pseudomonadota bacterium]MBU1399279.1 2-hydroxyacyl-CoA dehydratase family protein [Pseudomonadota bacterium]